MSIYPTYVFLLYVFEITNLEYCMSILTLKSQIMIINNPLS